MDKIRFMVVSGFLGAGKTTTMIALAEYMDRNIGKTAEPHADVGLHGCGNRQRLHLLPDGQYG